MRFLQTRIPHPRHPTGKYATISEFSMAVKLAAFFITLVVNIAAGVVIFFFMLLAMNGFSESDATYGLGAYIVLGVIVSLLMSSGAVLLVHTLLKRKYRGAVAALIAVPAFSVIGVGLKIVCSIIGILIADYVRVHY